MRRLAAKVALEPWAQMRGAEYVRDNQFDVVREFVRDGTETRPARCEMISDSAFVTRGFNFAIPKHAVYVNGHPITRTLGAVVAFFGLFYYWVILSTRFAAVAQIDDLLSEHAQSGETETPLLRGRIGPLVLPWDKLASRFLQDPQGAANAAARYAKDKLQNLSVMIAISNSCTDLLQHRVGLSARSARLRHRALVMGSVST